MQEVIQKVRQKVWAKQGKSFQEEAILEVDGTIAVTSGECKQGMDIAYNGEWGYAPLMVTLANTKEVLYLVNRPGNRPSSEGAEEWTERAINQLNGTFQNIWLRGDTDFSMTGWLDGWEDRIRFVLGYDACANLKQKADDLPPEAWQELQRPARYEISSRPRVRPEAVKEQIVQRREYQNIRLMGEQVAEFDYRPTKCRKSYRMVVVRKNLSVEKGHQRLFEKYRYFFYITNDRQKSAAEVVFFANDRCNQENIIEQLKNGVHALRLPTGDL